MSDPRTTPHNGTLSNLVEATIRSKKPDATDMAPLSQKPGRLKRRRVTDGAAVAAGLVPRQPDLHDQGASHTFHDVQQERKAVLQAIRSSTRKTTTHPPVATVTAAPAASSSAALPAPEVCTWSTLASMRVADSGPDASQVPLDLWRKWKDLPVETRREGALLGLQDGRDSDKQRFRQQMQRDALHAHQEDQKKEQNGESVPSAEPSLRASDWQCKVTLQRLLNGLKGANRLTASTDRYDAFKPELVQKHLKLLLEKREHLPVMDANTASLLLAQAGNFPLTINGVLKGYKFPPCVRGDQCCGRTVTFNGEHSGTLMAWMSLQEYNLFLMNGTHPKEIATRCCILCYRYWTNRYYVTMMKISSRLPDAPSCFQAWAVDVDVPGGYLSSACLHPPDNQSRGVAFMGMVGPMVSFHVSHYSVELDSNGRIHWLQDAIVQKHTPVARPPNGQLLGTFLGRVRLEQSLRVDFGIQYYRNMTRLHHPIVCLARNFPAHFTRLFPWTEGQSLESIQPEFLVSLEDHLMKECELRLQRELQQLDPLDHPTRSQCWRTLKGVHQLFGDVRFAELYTRHTNKPMSPALKAHLRWMSPNIFSLGLDLSQHLMQCVFWDEKPPGVYTDLVTVLNKLLPQPCATRMFGAMLNKFVQHTDHGDILISSFCFLALLGSYYLHPGLYRRYVAKDRETEVTPLSLGDEHVFALRCVHFEEPSVLNDIYVHTPYLALYSMRAVMYALIRDQPCFYAQLEETMRISHTENVVNSFMTYCRYIISSQMEVGVWLSLLQQGSSDKWKQRTGTLQQALRKIPTQLNQKEEDIRRHMVQLQMQGVVNSYRVLPYKLIASLGPALNKTKLLTLYCTYRRRREPALTNLHASQWPECPELPVEIHRLMNQWLRAVGSRVIDPNELTEKLRLFPVSQEGFDAIMNTLKQYDELDINDRGLNLALRGPPTSAAPESGVNSARKKRTRKALVPLYHRWPQTMAIMRLFSRLYAIHRSCALVPLPRQVLEAQIDSLRRRWLLRPQEPLPLSSILFHWCDVCQTPYAIYSSVPRHVPGRKGRRAHTQSHEAPHALIGPSRKSPYSTRASSYFSSTNRRRKVSQRADKTLAASKNNGTAAVAAEKRGSTQPYGTYMRILKAFDAIMQEPHDNVRGLDVQAGSHQASAQMRISLRTITYFELMRRGSEIRFSNAKHELHTEHAHLEARRHLRDMAAMLTGEMVQEGDDEDEEDVEKEEEDDGGVGGDDDGSDDPFDRPTLRGIKRKAPSTAGPLEPKVISEQSVRRRGLWEAQARHLNYLVRINEAMGPATNTSGGPQSLKGSGCKRQTGQGYGTWCGVSDLIADCIYCRVKHERDGESCDDRPLCRTLILGHAFCMGRRMIMMCPNCAGYFVYTQRYCMYTSSKGYLCMSCTEYMRQMQVFTLQARALDWPLHMMESEVLPLAVTPEEREQMHLAAQEVLPKCVYCNTGVVRNSAGFSNVRIYDHSTLVCSRDSYSLNVYLNANKEQFQGLDKEEYRAKLVKAIAHLSRVRPSRGRVKTYFKRRHTEKVHHKQGSSDLQPRLEPVSTTELTRGTVRAQQFIRRSQKRRHAGLQHTSQRRDDP